MDSLTTVKVVILFILLITTLVFTGVPFFLAHFQKTNAWYHKYKTFFIAGAAGIVIGSAMIHMLPEAEDSLEAYYDSRSNVNEEHFHYAHLTATLTFIVLLGIDYIFTDDHDHHSVRRI